MQQECGTIVDLFAPKYTGVGYILRLTVRLNVIRQVGPKSRDTLG